MSSCLKAVRKSVGTPINMTDPSQSIEHPATGVNKFEPIINDVLVTLNVKDNEFQPLNNYVFETLKVKDNKVEHLKFKENELDPLNNYVLYNSNECYGDIIYADDLTSNSDLSVDGNNSLNSFI